MSLIGIGQEELMCRNDIDGQIILTARACARFLSRRLRR